MLRYGQKPPIGTPINQGLAAALGLTFYLPLRATAGTPRDPLQRYPIQAGSIGGASWARTTRGNALSFPGGTFQPTSVPNHPVFTSSSNFTITVWATVAGGAGNYRTLFCVPTTSGSWGPPFAFYCLRLTNGNTLSGWINDANNGFSGSTTLTVDATRWRHFGLTYDGKTCILYLDGVQEASRTLNVALNVASNPTVQPFQLGNSVNFGTEGWNGLVDELKFASRTWSAAEIAQDYKAPTGFLFQPQLPIEIFAATVSTGSVATASGTTPFPARLNRGEPLSRGLAFDYLLNDSGGLTARDSAGNQPMTWSGSSTNRSAKGPFGPCASFVSANSDYLATTLAWPSNSLNAVTMSGWFNFTTKAQYQPIITSRTGSGLNGIFWSGGAGNQLTACWLAGAGEYNGVTGIVPLANTWGFCAFVVEPTKSTLWFWQNGVWQNFVWTQTNLPYNLNGVWSIGRESGTSAYWDGLIGRVSLHARSLSFNEIVRLQAKPFSPYSFTDVSRYAAFGVAATPQHFLMTMGVGN